MNCTTFSSKDKLDKRDVNLKTEDIAKSGPSPQAMLLAAMYHFFPDDRRHLNTGNYKEHRTDEIVPFSCQNKYHKFKHGNLPTMVGIIEAFWV